MGKLTLDDTIREKKYHGIILTVKDNSYPKYIYYTASRRNEFDSLIHESITSDGKLKIIESRWFDEPLNIIDTDALVAEMIDRYVKSN